MSACCPPVYTHLQCSEVFNFPIHQFINPLPLQSLTTLCLKQQLGPPATLRRVSHGSPPELLTPAVLFIGREKEMAFFTVGVTHTIWQHTSRYFLMFLMLIHNKDWMLSETRRSSKGWRVMGFIFRSFGSRVELSSLLRDNGLFTPQRGSDRQPLGETYALTWSTMSRLK